MRRSLLPSRANLHYLKIDDEVTIVTLDTLYSKEVLRLAAAAHGAGSLDAGAAAGATRRATRVNPACGDRIDVAVALESGKIAHALYDARACLICQAAASALGAAIAGQSAAQIRALRDAVAAMLTAGGAPPPAPFEAFGALAPVAPERGRHGCVLLPIDAVLDALS